MNCQVTLSFKNHKFFQCLSTWWLGAYWLLFYEFYMNILLHAQDIWNANITMHTIYFRYVSVLVELTRMEGTRHGRMIASQMLDVAIRVQAIRPFAVSQMVKIAANLLDLMLNLTQNLLFKTGWNIVQCGWGGKNPQNTLLSRQCFKSTSWTCFVVIIIPFVLTVVGLTVGELTYPRQ